MKRFVFFVLFFVVFIPIVWVLVHKFESKKPIVDITIPSIYLKKSYEMSLNITDRQTGLRKIMVSIMQQGKEKVLLDKQYASSTFLGLFPEVKKTQETFTIPVLFWKYGMTDGEAVIRIMVSDYSWRGWNKGNVFYVEKKVVIDSKPPKVRVLTKRHNVERGGSGLVIYRVFEENLKSGVKVGDNFFPGHAGLFEDKQIYAAFFALSHMQGTGTQLSVIAEDMAGNITKRGFYHYIRDKNFKTDVLNISDRFLEQKVYDFDVDDKNGFFQEQEPSLLKKFLYINGEVRKNNVETILKIPQVTQNEKYWDGMFSRLNGSARRAGFADRRTYKYKGNEIDRAVHLGVDLASTSNAQVKAANSGKVILTKFIGIFGNTVMIDHGFGLCSLYAHLNHMSVNEGDMVKKGDDIGSTGLTGLAGGDHLHFSMIVHNVFVNPVEWWDDSWIKNNITSKIDFVKQID
ncbi:M23 family metallopeptidase [Desulfobacula toluolica]|uniref:Peptidase, M23 family n=1 Tax=Desulfobacula toluolica (strain DSM 7467 / Tol2) TaxID=651182 RepID=K0NGK1_DESTT|nr:M23 family metallopeptidase [Desulfobacula toluolica]CCK80356.1 peptidase, M23 family [Desulfobacula toluolica Tol2]